MTDDVYIGMILDRSGSMQTVLGDAIGGFNSFLSEQQKQHSGTFRLAMFDSDVAVSEYHGELADCNPLTEETYVPGGMTALYDAIGMTVHVIGEELSAIPESERPVKVAVAILTDGMENSSRHYQKSEIKEMIEHQQDKYNWDFIFLGANMDACAVGGALGIKQEFTEAYTADGAGTRQAYNRMSGMISKSLTGS